jgi:hypothetical protein
MIQLGVEFSLTDTSERHVLMVQDTSELSFGFNPFQSRLSEVGNGAQLGFFVHPVIALVPHPVNVLSVGCPIKAKFYTHNSQLLIETLPELLSTSAIVPRQRKQPLPDILK